MFAAGSGSIPDIPSIIMTLLSIVSSGICFDAIKDLLINPKGGHVMKKMLIIMISWLCCCGNMV